MYVCMYIFFILFSRIVLDALSRAFYIRKNRDFIFYVCMYVCMYVLMI